MHCPLTQDKQSMRSQYLYRASELTAAGIPAGDITAMQLFISSKASTRPFAGFTIKMGHSALNYLIDGAVNVVSGLTNVYTNAALTTTAGWNNFVLTTPFTWDGINNIAIEICYDNITADAANFQDAIRVYTDGNGAAVQGNMYFQNGINCSGSFSSVTYATFKPVIKFSYAATGTTVETAAGATKTGHIDMGSNDYFYSNNNKLLLKLSGINASLGCVTSVLDNAGTTWVNYMGGQRSAKVFAVTPTTNISTTNYTAAFYFDNSELGGKTASTLKIAKTTAASVAAANGSNTVLVTPTVTALGSGTTVFTGSFTGFSRFFLADAGVVLPVNLTDFTAVLNTQQNTELSWTTGSEQNNRQFDVETSRDGMNFVLSGVVASKGNSSTPQQYEYLHIKPQQGITWYRLKQTDLDGNYTYSKIISLNMNKELVKTFVYPVPAKDKITIYFGTVTTQSEIEIFSADMKIVQHERVNGLSVKKELDISDLPNGVYFIRLLDGTSNKILRFIKE